VSLCEPCLDLHSLFRRLVWGTDVLLWLQLWLVSHSTAKGSHQKYTLERQPGHVDQVSDGVDRGLNGCPIQRKGAQSRGR
jgi:hypothetical protein